MLTPERQNRMDIKLRQTQEPLKRTEGVDYRNGYFFVTLVVHDRLPLLGRVYGRYIVENHQVLSVGVHLTSLGEEVQKCWQAIPTFHPDVELIDAQVMPEHFHSLLRLKQSKSPLGKIINGFMVGCTHAYWDILGIDWRSMSGSTNGSADSRWTDWLHQSSLRGPSLFSAGYNDTLPITPDEVQTKIAYIRSNPERRLIKGSLPDCFAIHRGQHSPNWTLARVGQGLRHDTYLANSTEALQTAFDDLRPRLLPNGDSLALDYVGSPDLLTVPRKLPLICHRADAERFPEQAAAIIREAEQGAVIVSAFISPREREILRTLIAAGCPVIEITDNGFGKTYRPRGTSFYACAESRLLQITPWTYHYEKEPSPITRPMCMVMNELARLICAQDEDWWKK